MPVKTAFDMDDVQLFDYCQRNEVLGNPEISSIFGNEFSQTDSKRETSVNPSSTTRYTRDCLESANGSHAAAADTSTKFSTCTTENLIPDNRSAAKELGADERQLKSKFSGKGTNPESTELRRYKPGKYRRYKPGGYTRYKFKAGPSNQDTN